MSSSEWNKALEEAASKEAGMHISAFCRALRLLEQALRRHGVKSRGGVLNALLQYAISSEMNGRILAQAIFAIQMRNEMIHRGRGQPAEAVSAAVRDIRNCYDFISGENGAPGQRPEPGLVDGHERDILVFSEFDVANGGQSYSRPLQERVRELGVAASMSDSDPENEADEFETFPSWHVIQSWAASSNSRRQRGALEAADRWFGRTLNQWARGLDDSDELAMVESLLLRKQINSGDLLTLSFFVLVRNVYRAGGHDQLPKDWLSSAVAGVAYFCGLDICTTITSHGALVSHGPIRLDELPPRTPSRNDDPW